MFSLRKHDIDGFALCHAGRQTGPVHRGRRDQGWTKWSTLRWRRMTEKILKGFDGASAVDEVA
jgi:hypothetical protein